MDKTGIEVFETSAREYDDWFEQHRFCYESEVLALKTLAAPSRGGLEVGVGTGRFAVPLGIAFGLEPAPAMAAIARARGVQIIQGVAEALPLARASVDLVAIITALCFFRDPFLALTEATRVLASPGQILIGMIDKDSPLGRRYEANRLKSKFYRDARFYGVGQVLAMLRDLGYRDERVCQTIFKGLAEITSLEPVQAGFGAGGFVVISARQVDGAASAA
ncbi:MAG TPA: methyltransferase domain-containing protein [Desulfobaccales bacterium]|nr:methyltransferase domain-containing protein [Desulfobaccales bacterium]